SSSPILTGIAPGSEDRTPLSPLAFVLYRPDSLAGKFSASYGTARLGHLGTRAPGHLGTWAPGHPSIRKPEPNPPRPLALVASRQVPVDVQAGPDRRRHPGGQDRARLARRAPPNAAADAKRPAKPPRLDADR